MKLQGTLLLLGLSFGAFSQGTQTMGTANNYLDISNIKATIQTGGDYFCKNPGAGLLTPGFEAPKGSGKYTILGGGLWLGGKDQQNNLYVASQTSRQLTPPQVSFWPGPIGTVQNQAHSTKYDKVWKVSKAQIQNHIANCHKLFYVTPPEIANWPGNGNTANGEAAKLAPFVDVNNDGIYTPSIGDYPDIKGDQAAYVIINDKGNVKMPATPSMNLEVHIMFYEYNLPSNTAVHNTVFAQYRIINRGQTNFHDFYAGIYTNIDLGNQTDDWVGFDYATNRYFGYNGDPDDDGPNGYGLNPPAQSVTFLDKQIDQFIYINNNSNPTTGNPDKNTETDYYNYLKGVWKDGKLLTYGTDGTDQSKPPYKFAFPSISDPHGYGFDTSSTVPILQPFDWTEYNIDGNAQRNIPGDRQGLGSIGPINLNAGQELKFSVAYTFTAGSPFYGAPGQAQQDAIDVQNFFRNAVISGTKPDTEKQPLLLFPNPATDQLTIQLPDRFENEAATIQITDYTGRKVLETLSNSGKNLQLNISGLSKGIYQVSVVSENQRISSKLVKM